MKLFTEFKKSNDKICFIAKKGNKFLTVKNNELSLICNIDNSIAFNSQKEFNELVKNVICDDRNNNVLGNSIMFHRIVKK